MRWAYLFAFDVSSASRLDLPRAVQLLAAVPRGARAVAHGGDGRLLARGAGRLRVARIASGGPLAPRPLTLPVLVGALDARSSTRRAVV